MPLTLPARERYLLGLIADTHGHLPASALELFRGVDLLLHAGDIGGEEILETLGRVGPVVAVRGNMDWGPWADRLPESTIVRAGQFAIHLVHDRMRLGPPSEHEGDGRAVVSGHTHRAVVERKNGVLYVNPGSAGDPRHGRRASVALLRVAGGRAEAEIIDLPGG